MWSTSTYLRRPPTAAMRSPPESAFCRWTWPHGRRMRADTRRSRTRKVSQVLGWRELPVDPDRRRSSAPPRSAVCLTWRSSSSRHPIVSAASTSTVGSTRCASGPRRADVYFPVAVQPDHRLQGHADDNAAAAVLSRPARRTLHERHRHRAQSVLHQHVPVLAAGPPVPLRRPQRRDQHRARQPQPYARARSDAGERRDPRRPRSALADLHTGRPPTPRPSTRFSSCCTSAVAACRMPC